MERPPLITIAVDENTSDRDRVPMYESDKRLGSLLDHFGAAVNYIPYTKLSADRAIEESDALIGQGGLLWTPDHYHVDNKPDLDPKSERFEHLEYLIPNFVETGKPFIGLCLSMQILGGLYGCKFEPDLKNARPDAIPHKDFNKGADGRAKFVDHDINIVPGTTLHKQIGQDRITVNSFHNTYLAEISDEVIVSAYADDGIPEAIQLRDYPEAQGIQWHQEKLADDLSHPAHILFENFVKRAAEIRDLKLG